MTTEEQDSISKKIIKGSFHESKKYNNSDDFIDIINLIKMEDRTDSFKNMVIHLLEVERNEEGYYLDSYGKGISYNGIKTLKKENTKTEWNKLQISEYTKCAKSFEYFFYNYCKIMTKKGYNFPDIREYQKRMIHGMDNYERLILSISRQMGKTVLVASYILWKSIFGKNTTHGIAAQLHGTATEVLDKFKEILFGLPFCFLPGVKIFNKSTVSFDNGVRILCSTANGNAFRGFSIVGEEIEDNDIPSGAILYIDEAAYIANNDIKDFEDSVLPTVESVPNSQIFKSSTAKGRNHWFFDVSAAKKNKFTYKENDIITEINMTALEAFECNYSDNINIKEIYRVDNNIEVIKFKGKSGYAIVEANYKERFPGDELAAEEFKNRIVAEKDLVFFQQAHANEFLGSSRTLVNDKVLDSIDIVDDEDIIFNTIFEGLKIYVEPQKNHNYIVTCDPKKDGIDAVGIHVIDVTSMPFVQVAIAQIMESYMVVPGKLFDLGNYYNTAMVVCENNVAESIPTTLYYQYDYEGDIYTEKSKKGKKKTEMGFRTTVKTKRMGLTMLKSFIEEENLIIKDRNTVSELFNFIEKKNGTFSAEEGYSDDLVMSLMLTFAPFLDFKNWEDFKGFADLLHQRKKEEEEKEIETADFLDLGFGPGDDESEVLFTESAWEHHELGGMSASDLWKHDISD